MFKFNVVGTFLILLVYNKVLPEIIECPSHCQCDIFESFRRAICKNHNLVTVEAEIPSQVELLDLSYNLIHELHDHIFIDLNFTSLRLLNISHNKIGQIHMNAFADLYSVMTIDLSYNNVEYLMENWFWHLPKLEEVYLQGNNLRNLRDAPVIESKSIKILDLSSCSLPHVHEDAFSKLPNLQILDLSKNNLIQLKVNVITPLASLKTLKLENNTWHCNDIMTSLRNYCTNRPITCTGFCNKPPPSIEKFQKVVVAPESTTEKPKNFWIYDIKKENRKNNTIIIEVCSNNSNINNIDLKQDFLMEIITLSPILAIIIPFVFGVVLGLTMACIVALRKPNQKVRTNRARRRSVIRKRQFNDLYDYPLMQPESFEVCESTPVPLRKTVLSNYSGRDSFV